MASVYRGHNDTFFFDENSETTFLSENRLRFAALSFVPHIIIYNVANNGSKYWYRIAGPLYSLLKEAALKGNLSLYYYDLNQSVDRVKQAVMKGSFDIFGFPTYARMESAKKMWNSGVIFPIGHSMDVISLDHVLYRFEYPAKKLFVFSRVLDIYCWLVFLVLLFLVSIANHFLVRKHSVLQNLWFYAMSCFRPLRMFQKGRDKFLATVWCFMIVVFLTYYDSQFFSNITMKQQPIIIDSLEDLAKRSDLKVLVPATIIEYGQGKEEFNRQLANSYFLPDASYFEALRPRLKFYRQDKVCITSFQERIFEKVLEGHFAWLSSKCGLKYRAYHFMNGKYRDRFHVSKSGGDWQPLFFSMLSIADFHRELIETVIIQLSESGIYHLWKQDVVEKIENTMLAKVKSERVAIGIDIFWGTFIVMAIMLFLAFVSYFIEVKINTKEIAKRRKRRKSRFIKQFNEMKAHYASLTQCVQNVQKASK